MAHLHTCTHMHTPPEGHATDSGIFHMPPALSEPPGPAYSAWSGEVQSKGLSLESWLCNVINWKSDSRAKRNHTLRSSLCSSEHQRLAEPVLMGDYFKMRSSEINVL